MSAEDLSGSAGTPRPTGVLKLRSAQREFIRVVDKYGVSAIVARRQYGKTTIFATIATKKMMKRPGHTVVFGSAKLNLSREIVRKEAEIIQKAFSAVQAETMQVADGETGRVPDRLTADDFAELFEAQRLEFRYFHSRSVYSRTKVVALRPDTVGETGDLMADEIGRIQNWHEVWEAIEPIVSSDPTFRLTLSTTPPPDDAHFSFEMLCPPLDANFAVNPKGNLYRSDMGIMVLRVDAYDAFADGVPVYDLETREPLDPDEHRRRAFDKDAWDRNYGVKFVFGGTAACGLLQLDTAMRRGKGECEFFLIESDEDLERSCEFLTERISSGRVGLGLDVATTEKEVSNPSSLAVIEERGSEFLVRGILLWKTADPEIARHRVESVIDAVKARKEGGAARRLCIDATNERYFATELRKQLAGKVPVQLVIGSETIQRPGMEEPMTMKQFLGGELVSELDDNHLTLPAHRYVKEDFRLVKKERGHFVCEPNPAGMHGDTFDGTKLALHALRSSGGAIMSTAGIVVGTNPTRMGVFRPARLIRA